MLSKIFRNPFFRFILVSSGLYIFWYFLYEYYLKPVTGFDLVIIDGLVRIAESILQILGYTITDYGYVDGDCRSHIGIDGSMGVTIGAPCDGSVLFALFVAFIAAFPGPWKHKLWYLPVGVLFVHLVNVLRVVGLAVVVHWNENWLSFNHDYTFTLIVYSFVFLLWWIWVNKFSGVGKKQTAA
jgi:exosortase family protein XrtF